MKPGDNFTCIKSDSFYETIVGKIYVLDRIDGNGDLWLKGPSRFYGGFCVNTHQLSDMFTKGFTAPVSVDYTFTSSGFGPNVTVALPAGTKYDPGLQRGFTDEPVRPKCDCGGDKTYGVNSSAMEHANWCSKFNGSKK